MKNKIEYFDNLIKEWVIDEIPIMISESEKKEMIELFGNRKTGVLYRGMAINDKETLQIFEDIKNKKTNIFSFGNSFVSATPHKNTAKSFMEYIKSYHPSIIREGMEKLSETGCKGIEAAVLIEFEIPNPNQVIFKNYRDKGEDNNTLLPTRSAESEVLLYGDITISNVHIHYPLNKNNYKNRILDTIYSFENLENFPYKKWIEHNLNEDEIEDLKIKILEKLENKIKSKKQFLKYLTLYLYNQDIVSMLDLQKDVFKRYPELEKYILDKIILKDKNKPDFFIKINREYININKTIDGVNIIEKNINLFENEIINIIKNISFKDKLTTRIMIDWGTDQPIDIIDVDKFISSNDNEFYSYKKLFNFSKNNKNIYQELIKHDFYQETQKSIINFINKNILKRKKEFNRSDIFFLETNLDSLEKLDYFLIGEKDTLNKLFRHCYEYIPMGSLTKDLNKFLYKYSKSLLPKTIYSINKIITKINSFELLIKENTKEIDNNFIKINTK